MKPLIRQQGEVGRLELHGQFDFNLHREFREAAQVLLSEPAVRQVVVDFADVPFLDSSALGMLLLLREKAEGVGKSVVLENCGDVVGQVLRIANFHELFVVR